MQIWPAINLHYRQVGLGISPHDLAVILFPVGKLHLDLIRTLDDATRYGSQIPVENLLAQADQLILSVVDALEGAQETEIVRHLLRLRDSLSHLESGRELTPAAEAARAEVINVVNNFFYKRLTGVPSIKALIDRYQSEYQVNH